jgi:8-oxo-dGTP diphosphatase
MRRYVLGFVFDLEYRDVLLIQKARPAWQAGRLNGLGGKMEEGETSYQAMERELAEETAGRLGRVTLASFGRLRGGVDARTGKNAWEVWLFHGRAGGDIVGLTGIEVDGEVIQVVPRLDLPNWPVVPNVRYLVPMAHNHARGLDRAAFVDVVEVATMPPREET